MPAHDEEAFLAPAVRELSEGLRRRGLDFELVVVENGSTDATPAEARRLADEVPELIVISMERADYGLALRRGLLEAHGDVVAMFDVDYFDLRFLDAALARLGQDDAPTIVVASKRGAGAVDTRPPARRLVTSGFSFVLKHGFRLKVSDTHGMKVMRRAPVVPLAEQCRFGTDLFDTELVLRTERAGLDVEELPVTVEERRPSRTSIMRRIPRTVLGLARLRVALWRESV